MRHPTPLQAKTPFAIDPSPAQGVTTARAGLCSVSRVLRSLNIPGLCQSNLCLKERNRGITPAMMVESLILLHAAGGDCMEDIQQLREDDGVTRMLGFQAPSPDAVRHFLLRFHDPELVEAKGQHQLAFIPKESLALQELEQVQQGLVRAISRKSTDLKIATIDLDATIVESHKRNALPHYEGGRGYQPLLAVWSEADLIVSDQFRDGNVPAMMAPLTCAQAAFAALPDSVQKRYFRGDSACHEQELIRWLRTQDIGFGISARMSVDLKNAVERVPERDWETLSTDSEGTQRQWAEVEFVPYESGEKKDSKPLRYLGLRLLKAQGLLFADGSDRRHFAVLTNLDWAGEKILQWQREKAGTIEHVHETVKNELGGGQMPSGEFGANAAWWRISALAYNILSVLRRFWTDETLRAAKPKRLRYHIFNICGRFARDRRKLSLRFSAQPHWIKTMLQLFDDFPLATRSTF